MTLTLQVDRVLVVAGDTVTMTAQVQDSVLGVTPTAGAVRFEVDGAPVAGCERVPVETAATATCSFEVPRTQTGPSPVAARYVDDVAYGEAVSPATVIWSFENRVRFPSTGAAASWTVPDGVTSVGAVVRGAEGGPGSCGHGGKGAEAVRFLEVTPGAELQVNAGAWGGGAFVGFGGGGLGTSPGGGASDIRVSPFGLDDRVVVAGGGGGCGLGADAEVGTGSFGAGGDAGLDGSDGGSAVFEAPAFPTSVVASGGRGATGSSGGAGGSGSSEGNPGTLGNGGWGPWHAGGGGGGGLAGGGSGGGSVYQPLGWPILTRHSGGGGGGSSLVAPGGLVRPGTVSGEGSVELFFDGRTPTALDLAVPPAAPAGQSLTITPQVRPTVERGDGSGPSGLVDVLHDGRILPGCEGLAPTGSSCTASFVEPGRYTLTAVFRGDDRHLPSEAAAETLSVEAPTITSSDHATFVVGSPTTFTVTTDGGYPEPVVLDAADLPAGCTFVDHGDGTGTLSASPPPGSSGTSTVRLTARDASSTSASSQELHITVVEAPVITSAATATASVGRPFEFVVTTFGGPRPALSVSGELPDGLSFTDRGDGSALLAGTPAAGTGGAHHLTVTAHDNGVGPGATQDLALQVNVPPAVTSPATVAFRKDQYASFTITTEAFGFATPTFTFVGRNLDQIRRSGMDVVDNGDGTATISGTPTGVYPLAAGGVIDPLPFFVTNDQGVTASSLTVAVEQPTQFLVQEPGGWYPAGPSRDLRFDAGQPATEELRYFAQPAPVLRIEGDLPAGLSLADDGITHLQGTARITGTPTDLDGATAMVTLVADNGVGEPVRLELHIDIRPARSLEGPAEATLTVGQPMSLSYQLTGPSLPTTFRADALPAGIALVDAGDGSAQLVGTPAPGTSGIHTVSLWAENDQGQGFTQVRLTVLDLPAFTSATRVTVNQDSATNALVTTGSIPATTRLWYTDGPAQGRRWPTFAGLPPGLSFQDNGDGTATISGQTTDPGRTTYFVTLWAENALGTTSVLLTIDVLS